MNIYIHSYDNPDVGSIHRRHPHRHLSKHRVRVCREWGYHVPLKARGLISRWSACGDDQEGDDECFERFI